MKEIKMKKIDIAKQVCAELEYNKELCLQALVMKLGITRGNASIYFAKASDAYVDSAKTFATKPVQTTVKAPKEKEQSDASKAKVRQEHNKAHAHLSYTEPTKAQ
jgi:CRISPR/Cas system-associated endonuclease/helicase Cas3